MDVMRRIALTLHALTDEDRLWVLERLAPADRSDQLALLAELQELGIPPDQTLLSVATEQVDTLPRIEPQTSEQIVGETRPEVLARALRGEPSWMAAQILVDFREQSTREVLACIEKSQRQRVQLDMRDVLGMAPRARQALAEALAGRCGAEFEATDDGVDNRVVSQTRWQRIRRRVSSWIR